MAQFEHPQGYYKDHFAWMPDWGMKLPEGYSALFMTPMNRFDLPFMNTTGVVDSDKVELLGSFPFLLLKVGRELYQQEHHTCRYSHLKEKIGRHELDILDSSTVYAKIVDNANIYRQPDGGVYKDKVWTRREYR
jgi:hypothetical protein